MQIKRNTNWYQDQKIHIFLNFADAYLHEKTTRYDNHHNDDDGDDDVCVVFWLAGVLHAGIHYMVGHTSRLSILNFYKHFSSLWLTSI